MLILGTSLTLIFCSTYACAEINVTLDTPQNNAVINQSINLTFICNATSDVGVYNVSLFQNFNGTFDRYGTKGIMQLEKDSNTTLLCHFDDSYVCEDGEQGVNSSSTDFSNSLFIKGVRINESDTLKYPISGNINLTRGAIEFWIKVGFDLSSPELFFFSTNNVDYDAIQIHYLGNTWAGGGGVFFTIIGDSGDYLETTKNVNWSDGEWHHIAAVWDVENGVSPDNNLSYLYVDGSNQSVQYSDAGDSYSNFDTVYFYLGSFYGENLQADNSVFDELRISSWPRSPEEINASFLKGAGNHSAATSSWTVSGVSDGTYDWNCLAFDNASNGNWSASNSSFFIDAYSPPAINYVVLSPNSTDDLDPGITINVTANITDPSNVSVAIFQYKIPSISTWTNVTMNNISQNEWNASFFVDVSQYGVWQYRIWANDTLGHYTNASSIQQYNVSVTSDYSWRANPEDLGEKSILFETNGSLGVVVINNTGDYGLNFRISSSFANTFFNISDPNSFDIPAKGVEYININVTSPSEPSVYPIQIFVNDTNGLSSPASATLNATLISSSTSAYLAVTIVRFENIVQQSSSGLNYSAKIRNIGSENASDVWINWTLPPGFSNTTGTLAYFAGNVSNGSTIWSNITIYVSSSANALLSSMVVFANSSSNTSAGASLNVSVVCSNSDSVCGTGCSYLTDDDCSTPQNNGGTGGTTMTSIAGIAKGYEIDLNVPPRFDINRGERKSMRVEISNMVAGSKLKGVMLSMSGYVQTFMNFSPSYIDEIGYGETKYFDVEISAPIYAIYGEYSLNITASGTFTEGDKTTHATKNGVVFIVTHKFIGNDTMTFIDTAKNVLIEMTEAGLDTTQVSDLIERMNKSAEEGNYDNAKDLADEVAGIRGKAFSLNSQLSEAQQKIDAVRSANVDLPQSEKMLSLAKSAFLRGDYAKAEERLSSTMLIFAVESGNAGLWIFVKNFWWVLVPVILAACAGAITARKRIAISTLNKKLDLLVDEERVIQDLIASAQKEHFIERRTNADEYERSMKNFENGINAIKKKRADSLLRLSRKLKKGDALKKMKEEKTRVKGHIVDLQNSYFRKGKMGKSYYERIMKGLRSELIEVQRIEETVESDLHD
jgi:hypothetical protein